MMRFLSCFSGIEAASVAFLPLGWQCVGVAEVEPFPCAVLAHHYPDVPNLGDVTADDFLQRASALRPDVLVGGPPCQDFSVAGLRAGLAGDRGNLSLRWVEIIRAIRPAFAVTENVPGWLSVSGGHAFGAFLAGLVGHDTALLPPRNCGGRWTDAGMVAGRDGRAAWRVMDAQHFGLAQRRRRVFVVFCPRDGADPATVLLESKGVQRDFAPRREAREETSGTLSSRSTAGGGLGTDFECSGGVISASVAPTLNAHFGSKQGLENQHIDGGCGLFVAVPLQEISKRTGVSTDDPRAGIGIGQAGDPMFTLPAGAQHGVAVALRGREGDGADEDGDKPHVLAFDARQSDVIQYGDQSGPPEAAEGTRILQCALHALEEAWRSAGDKDAAEESVFCMRKPRTREWPLREALHAGEAGADVPLKARSGVSAAVRRLTPRLRECARLQGLPDDYLDVTFRGRPAADGNKYRALGNSFAVPVVRWIGERIAAQDAAQRAALAEAAD